MARSSLRLLGSNDLLLVHDPRPFKVSLWLYIGVVVSLGIERLTSGFIQGLNIVPQNGQKLGAVLLYRPVPKVSPGSRASPWTTL